MESRKRAFVAESPQLAGRKKTQPQAGLGHTRTHTHTDAKLCFSRRGARETDVNAHTCMMMHRHMQGHSKDNNSAHRR